MWRRFLAAMILVDEGKLRLDSPVAEILPALKDMKVAVGAGDGDLQRATPRARHPVGSRSR